MRGAGEVQVETREGLAPGEDGVADHPHIKDGPKGRRGEANAYVLRQVPMRPVMRVEHMASNPERAGDAERGGLHLREEQRLRMRSQA